MKLLQFRYIFLFILLVFSAITYFTYAKVIFDLDDSNIWYGPLNTGFTNSQATVTTDNLLDGGPFSCLGGGFCGDGIVNGSDICDKADIVNKLYWGINGCNNSCKPIAAAVCGDGIKTPPEFCDDGVENGQPGKCKAVTCDEILPKCGNSVKEGTEQCDLGTTGGWIATNTLCSHSCKIKIIVPGIGTNGCWDDEIDPLLGEVCDDGITNSDSIEGSCKTDCSGRVPYSCIGCLCDNSCPTIVPPDVDPPPPPVISGPTNGQSTDTF